MEPANSSEPGRENVSLSEFNSSCDDRRNGEMLVKEINQCNVCKSTFTAKTQLSAHMLTHTSSEFIAFSKNNPGQKPFTLKQVSNATDFRGGMYLSRSMCKQEPPTAIFGDRAQGDGGLQKTVCAQTTQQKHSCLEDGKIRKTNEASEKINKLPQHERSKIKGGPLKCNLCGKDFRKRFTLAQHECVQQKDQTNTVGSGSTLHHECNMCKLMFEKDTELQEHLLFHGIVKQEIRVSDENDGFEKKENLDDVHKEDNTFSCESCGEGFDKEDDFISHICSDVPIDKDTAMKHHLLHGGLKSYACANCDKVFPRKQLLVIHERKHTGETPFKCTSCGKGFAAKNSLTKHEMIHTGEKPCVCTICGKAFGRSGTLTVHMRIHTGEKPYHCTMCDESFTRRQLLIIHERKHTGEKPYKCETCNKGFITKNTLNKHEMTHTGERPCICTVCGKSFARKSTLNIHMRTHTGDTPYKCAVCDRGFVNNVGLKYHMTTVHKK